MYVSQLVFRTQKEQEYIVITLRPTLLLPRLDGGGGYQANTKAPETDAIWQKKQANQPRSAGAFGWTLFSDIDREDASARERTTARSSTDCLGNTF